MSTIPATTKCDVNQKHFVCVNPNCSECPPGYGNFAGKKQGKCWKCGQGLIVVHSQPVEK